MQSAKRIIVTGDITIDWNLARLRRSKGKIQRWGFDDCTRATSQPGGAALLANLIDVVAKDLRDKKTIDFSVIQPDISQAPIYPGDNRFHHSYALWSLFENGKKKAWRVEEYLGLDTCTDIEVAQSSLPSEDFTKDDIVVLDDADLGFRNHHETLLKTLKVSDKPPWILLKMSQPVAQGPLWEYLLEYLEDRLIVVTTVNDLRQTEVQISKGLSWERTAQDVVWELVHNPLVNGLARCAAVVVSFDLAGAVVLHHTPIASDTPTGAIARQRHLFFDPKVIEGMWEQAHPGGMIGYTTCLIAGIARQVMIQSEQPDMLSGIQAGLKAMRNLHLLGYEDNGEAGRPNLVFPTQRLSHYLAEDTNTFAVADIQDPVRFLTPKADETGKAPQGGFWTILQSRYQDNLEQVSEQIVLEGPEETIKDVPLGVFGALLTVDRQEIESFRSIATLAGEYLSQARPKRPLSIGVFGAPGSGKSFGITQVANSLAPGRIKVLEFNLSQFESTDELGDALHQVRDVNLSGKFPLVFWDEFDTPLSGKPLGWLRYFLAPMQDGAFREGQVVHPIGPAIFVFAGGTSERMASFGHGLDDVKSREAKVPDFISRLKGFVNVLGPNPQGSKNGVSSAADPFCIIRRAILLRSILWRNARHLFQPNDGTQVLNIDKGVLRAFLKTRFYKHGIRSMESIAAMSQIAGKTKYERSSLPPEAQLDLHVDGQEFLALVQQLELTKETLDKLAILFHKNFCSQLEKQDYVYGEVTDDVAKKHSSLKDFYDLPEEEQEQNRNIVRHIHTKLTTSGYIMIPARSNELSFEFPGTFLEELAKMEHERWMNMKLSAGWKPAPKTVKDNKLHADLVPWDKLSDIAKDKDRDFVRAIPGILANAGYTVFELRP